MTTERKNRLYYGDNLHILREYIADESVDLIYLDPPFNSDADYNVLFRERSGEQSAAQIEAFEDTWSWSLESESAYQDVVTNGPGKLPNILQAMRSFLGQNDMMAYLTMMAQRMVELHRVLKDTGSIYLHCDTKASHYLKVLMDGIFGSENFINEISRLRSLNISSISRRYRKAHDVILFYGKSAGYNFNVQHNPLSEASKKLYNKTDERGHYQLVPLLVSGRRNGKTGHTWGGINPNERGKNGMHWVTTPAKLDQYERENRIVWPAKIGGVPRLKYYLEENLGVPANDLWQDFPAISSQGNEDLGFPTQKPESLLERIINASSNEGDVVMDPFCGCGTAIATAERLHRHWIGIDVTHLAITLIRHRLHDVFKEELMPYEVIGQPQDVASAQALALESEHNGRYQFEWWALGLVDARPAQDRKKGADSGVDGYINFFDDNSGKAKRIVAQVKSGHVNRGQIATLKGDMEREKAEIGLFITLQEPTRPMFAEATAAGFYTPEHYPDNHYPRIQILTIGELLAGGRRAEYPRLAPEATFRRAPRRRSGGAQSRFA